MARREGGNPRLLHAARARAGQLRPEDGLSVRAGTVFQQSVADEFTARGLRGKLQAANGPVLVRDAGRVVYRASFDENNEFTGLDIVSVSGPHAGLGSDEWCDAATEALGV